MTRMPFTTVLMAIAGLLLLGGCVGPDGINPNIDKYSTSCMFEVNPTGAVVYSDGDTEVTVTGGAPGEAEAMNACIRAKAAAAGDDLTVGAPAGVVEIERVDGTTVVETFTYGQPPAVPEMSTPAEEKDCRKGNVLTGGSGYFQCTN